MNKALGIAIAAGLAGGAWWLLSRPASAAEMIDHIPFLEEEPDYSRTIYNTDVEAIRTAWLTNYQVRLDQWPFWRSVQIILDDTLPYPAHCEYWNLIIRVRPEWCNPGVLAHEMPHIPYYLNEVNKVEFSNLYRSILYTDPLLILLDSLNDYMNLADSEAYCEVYRYLGKYMPASLKPLYGRLI